MKAIRGAISFIAFLAFLGMGQSVFAEEKRWSDQAKISFVDTGGNTNVMTLSAENLLKYSFTEKFLGAWKLSALYGKNNGIRSAESYSTDLRFDYLHIERIYPFAIGSWLKDEFAGIESRYRGDIGGGYNLTFATVFKKCLSINELDSNFCST